MTRRIAFLNARLIDPRSRLDAPGALLVEAGRIADLGPRLFADGLPADAETVDCRGAVLAPGLVDLRARIGEPGEAHKETIVTAGAAAAAGGVTALSCPPDGDPPIDDAAGIRAIARRAREAAGVKVFPQACITRGAAGRDLAELGLLAEAGAIAFSDGRRAVADARVMQRALAYGRAFDLLLMQHPEEPSLAAGGVMNAGELATRLGLPGIPAHAEVIMIERDLRLVEATGARYHVTNVTTEAAIEVIAAAKRRGLPVTCDTAPHYFALSEVDIGAWRTFAKTSPPLRGDADRRAVAAAVADGTIDAVASDHDPQDVDAKRVPFLQAAPGIAGLETLLPLALGLVHGGQMTLPALLAALSARPAEILRLPLGGLARGAPADLVLFDPDRPGRIDTERFRGKSRNSPYDGRPVQGAVIGTWVDGRRLFTED